MRKNSHNPIQTALTHLRSADPVMARLIDAVGPFTLRPERRRRFSVLARAIISQQVSTAAARTIRGRLEGVLDGSGLTAEGIARLTEPELRSVGLSRQKASYLLDLAGKCLDGTVRLDRIGRLSDEAVIEMLTQVKGIGRWTAEMILLFGLLRPDVVSFGDLAIIRGMKILYGLDEVDTERFDSHRRRYSPYGSTASLYLWAVSKLDPSQPPLLARSAR